MTTVQRAAQVFGWGFILVAILGFLASGGSMEADPELAPKVLGLFPVNLLHNLVHAAFGVWGIMAARSFSAAKSYATIAGALYLLLAVLGFVIPDTFGLIPIGGNDIWLHALLGLLLVSIGFTASGEGAAVAAAPAATTHTSEAELRTTRPPADRPAEAPPATPTEPADHAHTPPPSAPPSAPPPSSEGGEPDRTP